MRQKIYIFGLITVLVIFTGVIFKILHFPGAGILLTLGFVTLVLVFLPLSLINCYKSEGSKQNLLLYIVAWITCLIVFSSMLFKIMHWPGAGIMMIIALPFPYIVFLPVFLAVTGKNKNFSIYNLVFVLMLLVINSVFSSLLSLNVSRNRIDESFMLSANYQSIEKILNKFPEKTQADPVVQNINKTLGVVNSYRKIILNKENITLLQWEEKPETILRTDFKGLASRALLDSGVEPGDMKLLNGLKDLIKVMETTPGYEELAKEAPRIFDIVSPSGNEDDWFYWKFNDNNLSWVLIYLDGLETNLKLIKSASGY